MDRYLSSTDGSILLNLAKVISIFKPNNWNSQIERHETHIRPLEQGIYAETSIDAYTRVLDVCDIETIFKRLDDKHKMNIIKGAIGDNTWRELLLLFVMASIKEQLLKETIIIEMSIAVAEAIDKFCVMKESLNKTFQCISDVEGDL